jgi:hypothetical protein
MKIKNPFVSRPNLANEATPFLFAVFAILTGCATPVPPKYYVAPANQPQAQIASGFSIAKDFRNTIDISFNYGQICRYGQYLGSETESLFTIDSKESKPKGYVSIAAAKPIWITYHEQITSSRYCDITAEVTLEQNRKYLVVGGTEFKPGIIPLIGGTRQCYFAIVGEDDGVPVQMKKIDTPHFCNTRRPPVGKKQQ